MNEFEGQREGEEIQFVFRKHIIAIRKAFYLMIAPFLLASIPVLIWPGDLLWLGVAFGGLGLGLLIFFYYWIGWYFTIFVVTNQRIRQINQNGLFGKSVIDLNLSQIQNISYNVPGINGELFGFGTIVIQTFVGDLVLDQISHPEKTYNHLQECIQPFQASQPAFTS